ncbi:MAG: hypothetical protein ACYCS7_10275 [Acidimicrobiales bacterium]
MARVGEESFGIKTVTNALALRNRVLGRFELASRCSDPTERQGLMSLATSGGDRSSIGWG